MAYSKADQFKREDIELSKIAKALAHPARISIVKLLAQKNECICNDLVEELPLSQSTVSQHLKELKTAGVIKGSIDGPRVCYCLDWKCMEKCADLFFSFFKKTQEKGSGCC